MPSLPRTSTLPQAFALLLLCSGVAAGPLPSGLRITCSVSLDPLSASPGQGGSQSAQLTLDNAVTTRIDGVNASSGSLPLSVRWSATGNVLGIAIEVAGSGTTASSALLTNTLIEIENDSSTDYEIGLSLSLDQGSNADGADATADTRTHWSYDENGVARTQSLQSAADSLFGPGSQSRTQNYPLIVQVPAGDRQSIRIQTDAQGATDQLGQAAATDTYQARNLTRITLSSIAFATHTAAGGPIPVPVLDRIGLPALILTIALLAATRWRRRPS